MDRTQVPQIQIIYTQHAYSQYQNPMIQINHNSGNPSQLTPIPVPIATTETSLSTNWLLTLRIEKRWMHSSHDRFGDLYIYSCSSRVKKSL